jgi:hypothetical protein
MSGWLPIEIVLEGYPALVWPGAVPGTTVRWIHFGGKRLTEPFFRQSVAHLRGGAFPALEIEADIRSIVREGSQKPAHPPSGFIFHVSRCGSTLICNALKTLENAQVAAEPRPITRLFMPCAPQHDRIDPQREEERHVLAECLFNLFSCYRTGQPEPVVVKFTSQNSLCLSAIRGLWPNIPCLFVIRDPVEVMVSNLKDGKLNRFIESPALACQMCGTHPSTLTGMSVEDFCARVLGRYFDAAIDELGPNVRIIDYSDINEASICSIANFFQLDPLSDSVSLHTVFERYAKDQTGNTIFCGDRLEKLKGASPRIQEAANQWAIPQYMQLRAAGR